MPRPARTPIAGGVYHLTARGNDGRMIYRDDADRSAFLRLAREVVVDYEWRCLSYCLMTTHYHLMMRLTEPNLSEGMQRLNGLYAQRFNRRHGHGGHLFRGRFHSSQITGDSHLLAAARYIALNPVVAGISATPEGWPWSAHRTLTGEHSNDLVSASDLLRVFGGTLRTARRRYRTFVADGRFQPGPGQFAQDLPAQPTSTPPPALDEILSSMGADMGAFLANTKHGYGVRQIAAALGCHHTTVIRRIGRLQRSIRC